MSEVQKYYHGSGSASFAGIFKDGRALLRPAGKLLDEGIVPFSGELREGLAPKAQGGGGINMLAISSVGRQNLDIAIKHALQHGCTAWNPTIGKKNLESKQSELDEKRAAYQNLAATCDPRLRDHAQREIEAFEVSRKIDEMRFEAWGLIDSGLHRYIENPFPVLYGIDYDGEVQTLKNSVTEKGIPADVTSVMYVPADQIITLKQDASQWGVTDLDVRSFQDLEGPDLQSVQMERAFDMLKNWKYFAALWKTNHV